MVTLEYHYDGVSWSMDVDTGESTISTALGAAATGTVETTIVGGLKYSSNKGWNKREMKGKSSGGSKQTPAKNPDALVTKGEIEEARKAAEEAEKKKSEFSTRQRVKYASYLLKGEARHWWDIIKITHGDDVASVMKWEEFKDLDMENYCPQGLMDKLGEEFLKLQQNDMIVLKYMAKFNEKARFIKYQVATEERNIKLYIWGLRARIKGPVQQARPLKFQEAVELALMATLAIPMYLIGQLDVEAILKAKRTYLEFIMNQGWRLELKDGSHPSLISYK
nr:zinc finger, CCHC-type, retrotransposon Gag domain protein [Tanacetum cinerariifolium]